MPKSPTSAGQFIIYGHNKSKNQSSIYDKISNSGEKMSENWRAIALKEYT
ncbi:hypothetical protein [Dolichospermum flos-aquae]|uniref:Uncharacterized protein n=1 Tax=Dolichospermum flos-aquae LEGE 04289 TaxID=1828708 RepID=A0ACC5Q4W0_DOLFA|nr:hypothetical protein [Dolichospermum flos-aquae]MBE9219652.1 hypothetical protein [Dolichospermum flos-aquae LEGE 04289]